MLAELDEKVALYEGKELVSIYFGGGTPSLWDVACVRTLIADICARFDAQPSDLEISLESNPSDCTSHAFSEWQRAGVNRLLIGVQATNSQDLVTLGRDHAMGDGLAALARGVTGGFRSVGADVILGVPDPKRQGKASRDEGDPGHDEGLRSLREVAELRPQHISAYELTIEERTPFAKMVARGDLIPEDEDRLASLYIAADALLTGLGYEHYEVSSYSLPGARARHNSLYWQGADYLGLGNGAASLLLLGDGGARRWQNKRSASAYLRDAPSQHVDFSEDIAATDFAIERRWLAMRTRDGLPESEGERQPELWSALEREGLVERKDGRLVPTLRGFLYNNQLIGRLGIG